MRRLFVVFAAAAVLVTTIPTGGFNAAQADRGVSVAVADDANAYLGVEMRVERPPPDAARGANETSRTETAAAAERASESEATTSTAAGANAPRTAPSTDSADAATRLYVTLRNRLPGADSVRASVRVVDGGAPSEASASLVVDDEATARLPNVDCDDTVRIVARARGTRIELERSVPCEREN